VFGRHLAATNSTYRSNTSARNNGRDTTLDTDIAAIPDQRQILLDEQEARSLLDHRNIYRSGASGVEGRVEPFASLRVEERTPESSHYISAAITWR
jgi:hypothetical protein